MNIRFGTFTLDLDARRLTQSEREIHLTPKAFDLLALLVQERPKALSKADLQQKLWTKTFVVEANLSNLIAEIREALGDRARAPMFIRTAHGFGYSFCAEATALAPVGDSNTGRTSGWLEWDGHRFPLVAGENVLGRDPDVAIRLDSSTVSRRHARIVVTAAGATLEDFGSKNGTSRGTQAVTTPVPLSDGDTVRIGSVVLTFHAPAAANSTETQVG